MILPVLILSFVLTFPLSNGFYYGGQTINEGFYDYQSLATCSYERNSFLYSDDSVSVNNTNGGENNDTFEGVTQENFNEQMESFKVIFENVEAHEIEQISLLSRIFEILTYLTGFGLFIVLVLLLRYIYKFFKMFF